MCSISGVLRTHEWNDAQCARVMADFFRLVCDASERGRDSYGVTAIYDNGQTDSIREVKSANTSSELTKYLDRIYERRKKTGLSPRVILNNDRAEPTTEYVKNKSQADIQPFQFQNWIVTHNGTVANDKELLDQFPKVRVRPTTIDTFALPVLFSQTLTGNYVSIEAFRHTLNEVVGSYALAAVNLVVPQQLFLAVNYKPLTLRKSEKLGALFFTSLESSMTHGSNPLLGSDVYWEVPAYTVVKLDAQENDEVGFHFESLPLRSMAVKSALVVCSGGLDSVVAATHYVRQGYETGLVHFRYGCKAQEKELERIQAVASALNTPLTVLDVPQFQTVIGGSNLFSDGYTTSRGGVSGAEFAYEWVPARNLVFLSLAVALAESKGYDIVASGVNLEESGAYPDNEMIFINKLNAALPYATSTKRQVSLEMPVGHLMKHEIVKYGLDINAPLDLTWSCYGDGEEQCGICGPCFMRKTGFQMAGVKDPAFKSQWNQPEWNDMQEYR